MARQAFTSYRHQHCDPRAYETTYDPAGDGRPSPISQAQVGFRLLGSLLNAGRLEDHGFDEATRLARSTPAWAIRYRHCGQVEVALRAWQATERPPS